MIDMMMLIGERVPDVHGKVIPPSVQQGSMVIENPKRKDQWMTLVVSGAVYNPRRGTCGMNCIYCYGYCNTVIILNPFAVAVQATTNLYAQATYSDGTVQDFTTSSSWTSDNTPVATVGNSTGVVTGGSVGSANIIAAFPTLVAAAGQVCAAYEPFCPTFTATPSSGGSVTPKILLGGCGGTDITKTTQSAVVGQQIALCGSYGQVPSGVTVTSQSWSVPGTTEGGFTVASDFSSGGYTAAVFSQTSTTFYWLSTGNSQKVTFTLNLSNGSSPSASATFNVAGPTSVSLSPDPPAMGNWWISSGPSLQLGSNLPGITPGIKINGNATSPSGDSGTYEYVQIITTFSGTAISGSTNYN